MDVRKAFASLLESAAPKLERWLIRVAKKDPAKALDVIAKLAEFHVPKLAKLEHKVTELNTVRVVNMTGVRIGGGEQPPEPRAKP